MRRSATVGRRPGAGVLLVAGLLSRLGMGVTPLAMLLLIADATGRYAPAAVAGGIYSIASAAVAPLLGRIADRIGPTPVLLASAIAHPLALAALVVTTDRLPHGGSQAAVWAAAAVAG